MPDWVQVAGTAANLQRVRRIEYIYTPPNAVNVTGAVPVAFNENLSPETGVFTPVAAVPSTVGFEVVDVATTGKTLPDFVGMWASMLAGGSAA